MKVGKKLLVLIVPLLLVIVVLAGLGIRDRLSASGDAEQAAGEAEFLHATTDLLAALDQEIVSVMASEAGGDVTLGPIEDRSDTEAEAWLELVASSDLSSLPSDVQSSIRDLSEGRGASPGVNDLNAMRAQAFVQFDATDKLFEFKDLTDRLSQLSGDLALNGSSLEGAATFAEAQELSSLVHNDQQLNGFVLAETIDHINERHTAEMRLTASRYEAGVADVAAFQTGGQDATQVMEERTTDFHDRRIEILHLNDADADPDHDPIQLDATQFHDDAQARAEELSAQVDQILTEGESNSRSDAEGANSSAIWFTLGTLVILALSILLGALVARSIVRPLRKLTDAAYELANKRLPGLVERLKDPEQASEPIELEAIDIESRDEIGQLANAFNSIQGVTTDVAESQGSVLRKGISGIFVNLARRNQSLLDRQIEFIDELESNEESPEQLQNLFKLDHLATRMRRNAESLLVLAGEEPNRRRGQPVPITDVVRVAVGEVEEYSRIKITKMDEVDVASNVAVDIAHLLSELMENSASFSPPDTTVDVTGEVSRTNEFVVSVQDRGIGMTDEQLADANKLLADPPPLGLELARSLGFTVVSRLAKRWGIRVHLTSPDSGGVNAKVIVPAELLEGVDTPAPTDNLDQPKKVEPKKVEAKKVEPKKVEAKQAAAKPVEAKKVDAKPAAAAAATAAAAAAAPVVEGKKSRKAKKAEAKAKADGGNLPTPEGGFPKRESKQAAAPVAKAEPKKAEPVAKAEPKKAEPKQAAPVAKAEPTKAEPKKAEPVAKAEPKKAEPVSKTSTESATTEPPDLKKAAGLKKADTSRPEPAKAEAKSDSAKSDSGLADKAKKAGAAAAAGAAAVAAKAESAKADTGDSEAKKTISGLVRRDKSSPKKKSDKASLDRAITANKRSPEEIRNTLNQYHDGLGKGKKVDPDDKPDKLAEAVPEGDAFEEGLAGLVDEKSTGTTPEAPTAEAPSDDKAQAGAQKTKSGLVKRERGANAAPKSKERPVAATSRSPEEVRAMLDKYKGGLKKGRVDDDKSDQSKGS